MNIETLIRLLEETTKGRDNISEGAVGLNGYGFVFKNLVNSNEPYITATGSSKVCGIDVFHDYTTQLFEKDKIGGINNLFEQFRQDRERSLYLLGALKTIIPSLKVGGDELLFEVWALCKTPDGKLFPFIFYYGASGTSIGGWHFPQKNKIEESWVHEGFFSQNFSSIVNFSPFKFSESELEEFIEALVLSLKKVPISDYEGIYRHDLGATRMGMRAGKVFIETLNMEDENGAKANDTWSYSLMGCDEAWRLYSDYMELIIDSIPDEIYEKKYSNGIPDEIYPELIEQNYERLMDYAYRKQSRLAYMILGRFIMISKATLSEELKSLILKYTDWKYEKHQLKKKDDRAERKKFIDDFREKIKNYDGTTIPKIPLYTVTRVINEKKAKGDHSPIWRDPIDYKIIINHKNNHFDCNTK